MHACACCQRAPGARVSALKRIQLFRCQESHAGCEPGGALYMFPTTQGKAPKKAQAKACEAGADLDFLYCQELLEYPHCFSS